METLEQIAKTCHAAHLAYSKTHNLPTQPNWKHVEQSHKETLYSSINQILDGSITSAETAHMNFMEQKQADGWRYGNNYSLDKKTNPRLVLFRYLTLPDKARGRIFFSIVKSFINE